MAADWRPDDSDTSSATNEGFVGATDFTGIFEGNGHSISNLYSRDGGGRVGFFRSITSTASIRNLEVVDANIYASGSGNQFIGALVGQNAGNIIASSATGGTVNGSTVGRSSVGGLVGAMLGGGTITASYATGAVNGGAETNHVGGLVGAMLGGTNNIIASYAMGAVNGGAGIDYAGGLVGSMGVLLGGTNSIITSYATGTVNGGARNDTVGGLVGLMQQGTNSITASYATGVTDGGAGSNQVGALVGNPTTAGTQTITHSYGFGSGMKVGRGNDGTAHPSGLSGSGAAKANGLTAPGGGTTSADAVWDQVASKTKDAWDFGTNSQAHALRYADYDGSGGTDYCGLFPDKSPGTDTDLVCGTSLLPGQGR